MHLQRKPNYKQHKTPKRPPIFRGWPLYCSTSCFSPLVHHDVHLAAIPQFERNTATLCIQSTPNRTSQWPLSSRHSLMRTTERALHMDARTRVRLARFSEKIKKHPEVAQGMGATSAVVLKATKAKSPTINVRGRNASDRACSTYCSDSSFSVQS